MPQHPATPSIALPAFVGRHIGPAEADVAHTVTVHWGAPPREGAPVGAGWVTRRVIAAGEALRPPAVAPPVLVNAGEPVQVVARRGNVELTLRARAASSAAAGERVTVRTEAGRRLQGVAEVLQVGISRRQPGRQDRDQADQRQEDQ